MLDPQFQSIVAISLVQSIRTFSDCEIFPQKWEWGWKFYIYMPHIGQVHLHIPNNQPGRAVISDLVVLQHVRGQGHGRRLISLCETLANFLEADALGIWADPEGWQVNWYQRLGFNYCGANPEATTDIYLEKPLKKQK